MATEHDRDVTRFDRWAPTYHDAELQRRFFGPVQEATLDVVLAQTPSPRRVLDVGCGTAAFLRRLRDRLPDAELVGVDAASGMIRAAAGEGDLERIGLAAARAERLPFADAGFDLVTSTVSFHHWADQVAGLREVSRVLAPGGSLVLTDLHALGLLRVIFAIGRRRSRMHTRKELVGMLAGADLRVRYPASTVSAGIGSTTTGRSPLASGST